MLRILIPGLAVLLALGAGAPARALTTISTDTALPGDPVFGDTIADDVEVVGGAVLTINAGGSISGLTQVWDSSTVVLAGGSIGLGLGAYDTSTVSLSDGSIGGSLTAYNSSTVSLSGGSISGDVLALDSSTVSVSGSSIGGSSFALDSSTVNVSGGSIGGDLTAGGSSAPIPFDSSMVSLSGGSIGGSLGAIGSGTVTVFGSCLELAAGFLTGALQDGTSLNLPVLLRDNGQILLNGPDLEPPLISGLAVNPAVLWPPNHKLIEVTVPYTTSDNCSGALACQLSVTSNEPVNGPGEGQTVGDIQIVDAHHVKLRAERGATGNGRVYTITVTCLDASGNAASRSVTVTVPRSQGRG